jgi:tRNA(fMet)-specific endonuclease VapC
MNERSPLLKQRIRQTPSRQIAVCSVVRAELYFGSAKSNASARSYAIQKEFLEQFGSLSFDDDAAYQYAAIRADLERKGTPIGPLDLMIAAIALTNNLTLITHNTAEFGRIHDLQTADWETQ